MINQVFISLSNMSSYLYKSCLHIFIKHVFISLSNMSSALYQTCLYLYQTCFHIFIKHVFVSLSNVSSYLYQSCLHIFIKHVFISLSNMFSYLYQTCLQIFIGSSNIRFRIFTCIFTIYGYITNSQSNQIPDGLIAQLVEHCAGIAEVMGLNHVHA